MNDVTYHGQCFCGAVQFNVSGKLVAMGYCHCGSCRHWSASPANAFTLWNPDSLNIIKGDVNIGAYSKTENSIRKWCKRCGGHIFSMHPTMKVIDVYAACLPELTFTPSVHVNYQETVLPIKDGLPKFKDFPKEMGGSGELIPE